MVDEERRKDAERVEGDADDKDCELERGESVVLWGRAEREKDRKGDAPMSSDLTYATMA